MRYKAEHIRSQVKQINERLIQARNAAGLTQSGAAQRVGLSGASSLAQYESGRSTYNLTLFLQLCEAYEIDVVWALTGLTPEFDATAWMVDFNEARDDAIKALRTASYLLAAFQTKPKE